jgi:carbon-monoxide dehydrogenase small subunit
MLVSAAGLLGRVPNPTEEELRGALAGHPCECATFGKIVEGLLNAGVEPAARRPRIGPVGAE